MQIMSSLADVETLYDIIHKETNFIKDGNHEINDFVKEIKFENVNFI